MKRDGKVQKNKWNERNTIIHQCNYDKKLNWIQSIASDSLSSSREIMLIEETSHTKKYELDLVDCSYIINNNTAERLVIQKHLIHEKKLKQTPS